MPITRRQFEIGIDQKTEEWMKKIHSFLAEHKEEAFTEEELREHYRPTLVELISEVEKKIIQRAGTRIDVFSFLPGEKSAFFLALEKLVESRAAELREIRDIYYYSYREDL